MATQDAFEDKQFCRANTIPDVCTLYITSKQFEHSTNVCIEVDTSYKSFPLNEAGENCRKLWCSCRHLRAWVCMCILSMEKKKRELVLSDSSKWSCRCCSVGVIEMFTQLKSATFGWPKKKTGTSRKQFRTLSDAAAVLWPFLWPCPQPWVLVMGKGG